ncbi:MAG: ATP-grasp domain-containing protein, partial [Nitrosomonadales bacterium]|nr:ATP-grasp domain-containing protein [Nitrosomonadales bacterium]
MIDCAEDRARFQQMLHKLGLKQPPNRTASNTADALAGAAEIGYPLVVRPSNVLGGRAMEIIHAQADLERYMRDALESAKIFPERMPILLDRFLNDAIEVDVDAVSDGKQVTIGGIMEHIEQAGVHSGDSACSLPPFNLSEELQNELRRQTVAMAKALNVVGLMNVQFAIQGETVYVLEVNPRASRTVPFVSKATGVPLAKIAARCMAGQTLVQQGATREVIPPYFSVKEAVFPFIKFPGVDTILGPEMKSTGEVMGVGESFAEAFVKSQLAAGVKLPASGKIFISVREVDQPGAAEVAKALRALGFSILATRGTGSVIRAAGVEVTLVNKVAEGRPHIVDMIKNGDVKLIINTVDSKRSAIQDSYSIRHAALQGRITYYTTLAGARAACLGMQHLAELQIYDLQAQHRRLAASS